MPILCLMQISNCDILYHILNIATSITVSKPPRDNLHLLVKKTQNCGFTSMESTFTSVKSTFTSVKSNFTSVKMVF